MSQETFERVLNAIYAELPADIEKDDPQRYQDIINLIEGCVIAALVDLIYYPNPGRLISECRTEFGEWVRIPGDAIARADLSFFEEPGPEQDRCPRRVRHGNLVAAAHPLSASQRQAVAVGSIYQLNPSFLTGEHQRGIEERPASVTRRRVS